MQEREIGANVEGYNFKENLYCHTVRLFVSFLFDLVINVLEPWRVWFRNIKWE